MQSSFEDRIVVVRVVPQFILSSTSTRKLRSMRWAVSMHATAANSDGRTRNLKPRTPPAGSTIQSISTRPHSSISNSPGASDATRDSRSQDDRNSSGTQESSRPDCAGNSKDSTNSAARCMQSARVASIHGARTQNRRILKNPPNFSSCLRSAPNQEPGRRNRIVLS